MLSFAKLLPPALLALLFIPTTSAGSTSNPSTHRTHKIGAERSVDFVTYHPESTFETYDVDGEDPQLYRRRPRSTLGAEDIAVSFLSTRLNIPEDDIKVRTCATGLAANHVFLVQSINGVDIHNAVATVAFNANRNISSFSSSFVNISGAADPNPTVSLDDAINTAENMLSGTYDGQTTRIEFVFQPNGYAALTYAIQINNDTARTSYEAFVDAHTNNTLVSLTDFVVKASYQGLPITEQDTTNGAKAFQTITDPQVQAASPNGWHQEFDTPSNTTAGNNAIGYTGDQLINIPVQTSATLNFIYSVDLTQDPTAGTNTQGAVVNAFYVVNLFHDFSYLYGFTEETFNFQTNNFNKGGQGFDRILVDVHENSSTNGADFAIYPDGQSPKMLLYLFVGFSPKRDSALQNDILIHECQHGANNRMTGGGTGACFQTAESNGLDEGYADAMADCVSQGANTTDYTFGKHVGNGTTGLRNYVYSTSNITNTLRYSSLKTLTNGYDIGSVWANILHNVYAELVTALGWSSTALTDPTTKEGNVVFFHLLFDALLLQPCNPTFIQARDAWIQADANRYGSSHRCVLWHTFASRGLGVNATTAYVDDISFPPECDC